MIVPAFYFDGKSSRQYRVEFSVQAGLATMRGDIDGQWSLDDLRVSERTRHGRRKVTCPDGAYLEILDSVEFNTLLDSTGYRDSLVVRMQQSWSGIIAALLVTVVILGLGYRYGIPAVSKWIAFALPEKVERTIGKESLGFLDSHMFRPSALPQDRRNAISQRFRELTPPHSGAPAYEIIFRKSTIGPNAFALPSGQIVLTDEIVLLMNDDVAVMGILAHELGHLHERHLMRRIIQGSLIGAVATVLFGDVSAVIANVPTILMDMKYSRDIERDADDYAVALFKANHINVSSLAHVFEKLGAKSDGSMPYLSSHPASKERIARIMAAQ